MSMLLKLLKFLKENVAIFFKVKNELYINFSNAFHTNIFKFENIEVSLGKAILL